MIFDIKNLPVLIRLSILYFTVSILVNEDYNDPRTVNIATMTLGTLRYCAIIALKTGK